jgi:membrane associated rhomboid family serine protease
MATTLRDYIRQFNSTLDRRLTRGVKWLILANVAVFLVEALIFVPLAMDDVFIRRFAQNPIIRYEELPAGAVGMTVNWLCVMQFFTYMFVHASPWHLFMNMLALWFFGPPMEARWGTPVFLKFYLFTGFMAGMLHGMAAPFFIGHNYVMLGASGAIFGVLLAFGIFYPHQQVLLWFVVPIPARLFVIFIGVFTFLSLWGGHEVGISHVTHLAGLAFGYAWIRLREIFPMFWLFNGDPRPFARHFRRSGGFRSRFD